MIGKMHEGVNVPKERKGTPTTAAGVERRPEKTIKRGSRGSAGEGAKTSPYGGR